MSRKVNPIGLRIGVTKKWLSSWYAEGSSYGDAVIEDDKIRKYIRKNLRSAGIDSILIERSIKSLKMIIKVARPGVVIGRKGSGLAKIREDMKKLTKSEVEFQVEEVQKPDLSASIVAESIAQSVERRVHVKRAINMSADRTMEAGAKGIKVQAGGTIHGPNSVAMVDVVTRGAIPTQTIRADIDYASATAFTKAGTIGIKVWIYRDNMEGN